jgi:hypothetical protein
LTVVKAVDAQRDAGDEFWYALAEEFTVDKSSSSCQFHFIMARSQSRSKLHCRNPKLRTLWSITGLKFWNIEI